MSTLDVSLTVQGVTVTRLHSFATFAPYRWRCQNPRCAEAGKCEALVS